jgi:hypothetical protein
MPSRTHVCGIKNHGSSQKFKKPLMYQHNRLVWMESVCWAYWNCNTAIISQDDIYDISVNSDWINNNPTGGLDGIPPDDKKFPRPLGVPRSWWNLAEAQGQYGVDNTAMGLTGISTLKPQEHKRKPPVQKREKIWETNYSSMIAMALVRPTASIPFRTVFNSPTPPFLVRFCKNPMHTTKVQSRFGSKF